MSIFIPETTDNLKIVVILIFVFHFFRFLFQRLYIRKQMVLKFFCFASPGIVLSLVAKKVKSCGRLAVMYIFSWKKEEEYFPVLLSSSSSSLLLL